MTVTISDRGVKRAFRALSKDLKTPRALYRSAGIHFRGYVRNTITKQGRPAGTWPKLARMTKMRTGRRKALITLRNNIHASWDNNSATVYSSAGNSHWDLFMHHTGFRSRAVKNKRMIVPLVGGGSIGFTSRKASVIPARPLWPSQTVIRRELKKLTDGWVNGRIRTRWRR